MNARITTAARTTQLSRLVDQISTIVVGKRPQVEDAVACLLAGGHLLIEDVPGVGKTTLAHALAVSLGLDFRRVQFTADLMPSDLIGVSVFERAQERFVFHPGPVFAQVLLADEINRAGPKTQSALLEAMEEHQVSVDNETRPLPEPFFVIATQNPSDQLGTYPLPESQLDRFLLRITLGYPDSAAERELLSGGDRRQAAQQLGAVLPPADLLLAQQEVRAVMARFHHVVESSKVGCRKPETRFYEIACELVGVAPHECVFLDDLGVNLKPAAALGMHTIK
ncbi:MAG: hypothetical protein RLZZ341_1381, partial [Pseudomonadota bacterium]